MSYELNHNHIVNTDQHIIVMNDYNEYNNDTICCICLDNFNFNNDEHNNEIQLHCCTNSIHNYCLIELFVKKYKNCPLCRKNICINNYFDEKTFKEYINYFPNIYKIKNNYEITKILYTLETTKFTICGYKFKSIKRTLYLFILNIFKCKNYQNILLLLSLWSIAYILVKIAHTLENQHNTNTEYN